MIFYCIMGLGSLWAMRWPLSPLVMVLAAAGVMEFLSSVLLDCIETARHLFLFHVITEILILCAFAGVLTYVRTLWRRNRRVIPLDDEASGSSDRSC